MQLLDNMWGNAEFYQLIQGFPGGVVIFGLHGEILKVNRAFAELLNCSDEKIYQYKYTDITSPDCHATEAAILKNQAIAQGHTDVYEKKYQLEQQPPVVVTQHVYLIRDSRQTPTFMLAMLAPTQTVPASSPETPAENNDVIKKEVVYLKKQNAKLQALLESVQSNSGVLQVQNTLDKLSAEMTTVKEDLAQSRQNEEQLQLRVSRMNTALEWKDKEIAKRENSYIELEQQLQAVKGELEVALIIESKKNAPPVEAAEAGPLPWDVTPETVESTTDDTNDETPWPEDAAVVEETPQEVSDPDVSWPEDVVEVEQGQKETSPSTDDAPWPEEELLFDDGQKCTEKPDESLGDAEKA